VAWRLRPMRCIPPLTVYDNIAFSAAGDEAQQREIDKRVREVAASLSISISWINIRRAGRRSEAARLAGACPGS